MSEKVLNTHNEEQHLAAMKQKELDSEQILEYIKFNTSNHNMVLNEELSKMLELTEDETLRRNIYRCIQISNGYTEYKVNEIAENTGFNRTRTKVLIKYLIEEGKLETVTLENTTFLRLRG